ncbi:hypothetical protein DPMN_062026 [Dreissena polymorpha]|uniref:Uncharacterized protein n=1 Tax=Dreissena polymorpha TaxID=45954 RepID=A0A9D4HIY1_DREPO|nr:hypothetical protein DPMN_062026 [Dreissena polymorpha]
MVADFATKILRCSNVRTTFDAHWEEESTESPLKAAAPPPMDFEDQDVELDVADSETCDGNGEGTAIDNGVAKALRHFTANMVKKVSKTTVRSMRDQGGPTMLGECDEAVQTYIKNIRLQGGVVNLRTMKGAAKAARHRLQKYGGHLTIEDKLARSILP